MNEEQIKEAIIFAKNTRKFYKDKLKSFPFELYTLISAKFNYKLTMNDYCYIMSKI